MTAEPRNCRAPSHASTPTAFRQLHPLVGRPPSRPRHSVASSPLTEPDPTLVSPHQVDHSTLEGVARRWIQGRTGLPTLQRPTSFGSIAGRGLRTRPTPQLSHRSAAVLSRTRIPHRPAAPTTASQKQARRSGALQRASSASASCAASTPGRPARSSPPRGPPNTGVKLRSSEVHQASSASTPCSAASQRRDRVVSHVWRCECCTGRG